MNRNLASLITIIILVTLFFVYAQDITGYVASQISEQPADNEAVKEEVTENLRIFLDGYSGKHARNSDSVSDIAYSCLMLADALQSDGHAAEIAVSIFEVQNITRFNDAWIIVYTDDEKLEIDAQEHNIIHQDRHFSQDYGLYSFRNPEDFREFMGMANDFESYSANIEGIDAMLEECSTDLTNMTAEYDRRYEGKRPTDQSLDERANIYQKLGECQAFSGMLNSEKRLLSYTEQAMQNKILSSAEKIG